MLLGNRSRRAGVPRVIGLDLVNRGRRLFERGKEQQPASARITMFQPGILRVTGLPLAR